MRAAMLAGLLAGVVGCGKKTSAPTVGPAPAGEETARPPVPHPSTVPPAKAPDPVFDANDWGKSSRWIVAELSRSRTTPKGDQAAAEAARAAFLAKVAGVLNAQPVNWAVEVAAVQTAPAGPPGVQLHPRFLAHPGDPNHPCLLALFWKGGAAADDGSRVFPLPDAAWGKTLAAGSRLRLRGAVQDVASTLPLSFWSGPDATVLSCEVRINFGSAELTPMK